MVVRLVRKGLLGLVTAGAILAGSVGLGGCMSTAKLPHGTTYNSAQQTPYAVANAPAEVYVQNPGNTLGVSLLGGLLSGIGANRGNLGAVYLGRSISEHGAATEGRSNVNVSVAGSQGNAPFREIVPFIGYDWNDKNQDGFVQIDEFDSMGTALNRNRNNSLCVAIRGYNGLPLRISSFAQERDDFYNEKYDQLFYETVLVNSDNFVFSHQLNAEDIPAYSVVGNLMVIGPDSKQIMNNRFPIVPKNEVVPVVVAK